MTPGTPVMLPVGEVVSQSRGAGVGFDRVEHLHGTTYKDCSTVVLVPTRGMIAARVANALHTMIAPMNQKRAILYCEGDEVGKAYDRMLSWVLAHPDLSRWRYVLTIEDDNLVPADAHIRLLESIEDTGFDAVGGLYFTKGEIGMPMAYGDPAEYARTGTLDFRPRNVADILSAGRVLEVNGIAMGCSLYRMDLFRRVSSPWFVTMADVYETGPKSYTQDLSFCERAKQAGARFGVDGRVRVGHLDINTGIVW